MYVCTYQYMHSPWGAGSDVCSGYVSIKLKCPSPSGTRIQGEGCRDRREQPAGQGQTCRAVERYKHTMTSNRTYMCKYKDIHYIHTYTSIHTYVRTYRNTCRSILNAFFLYFMVWKSPCGGRRRIITTVQRVLASSYRWGRKWPLRGISSQCVYTEKKTK